MKTSDNPMLIREAMTGDVQRVLVLEQTVFGGMSYPLFFFRQAVDAWPDLFLVVDYEERAGAYTLACPGSKPDEAWILSLVVLPELRGRGIGRELMIALLQRLQQKGFRRVKLTVTPENPVRKLYRALGFEVTDDIADYFGAGERRLIMTLLT